MAITKAVDQASLEHSKDILMPKMRHRFRLYVQKANGDPAPELKALEVQLIAFDIGTEMMLPQNKMPLINTYVHRTNRVVLWLEDDVTCVTMKAIRAWQADPYPLKLILAILNGESHVLEAYTFTEGMFDALQHSMWSYSPPEDKLELKVKPSQETMAQMPDIPSTAFEISGSLYAATARSTSMKLLQIEFKDMHHSIAYEPIHMDSFLA